MSLRFGVYGLVDKKIIEELRDLKDLQIVDEMYFVDCLADKLNVEGYSLDEMIKKEIDFVMSVGGDGTLLRLLQSTDIPALGVNTGTVGFLTTIEISDVQEALKKIDQDDYFVDKG